MDPGMANTALKRLCMCERCNDLGHRGKMNAFACNAQEVLCA